MNASNTSGSLQRIELAEGDPFERLVGLRFGDHGRDVPDDLGLRAAKCRVAEYGAKKRERGRGERSHGLEDNGTAPNSPDFRLVGDSVGLGRLEIVDAGRSYEAVFPRKGR